MKITIKILIYMILFLSTLEGLAYLSAMKPGTSKKQNSESTINPASLEDDMGRKGVPYGQWKGTKLNRFGFNDTDDYELRKPDHVIRIVCLGDSITFGAFTPPYNWPKFLEEKLRAEGFNVEVINAAFPGNSYPQLISRFFEEYDDFKPDYVLIYKGFRHYMAISEDHEKRNTKWVDLFEKSHFLSCIIDKVPQDPLKRLKRARFVQGISKPIEVVQRVSYDTFRDDLSSFVEGCAQEQITPVLASFPSLVDTSTFDEYSDLIYSTLYFYPSVSCEAYLDSMPKFNTIIAEIAETYRCPMVDFSKSVPKSPQIFSDDYHLTVQGSRVVADECARVLGPLIKSKNERESNDY